MSKENWEYYRGSNLFQFWIGPTVSQPDKLAMLQRVFQSANILAEAIDNWRDGLISEPFRWQLKDEQGDRVDAGDAEVQLQRWLDWVNQQAIASDSEHSDPWSEFVLSLGVTGEGNLRLWQPARFANAPDPVHRIHLHSPQRGSVEVERGDDGFIDQITYAYGDGRREMQKLEGDRLMVTDGEQELAIATGGRWTVQQVTAPTLLTESVKKLQNSINHGLTMKLRNQELSGFRERVFLNAQPPGEWVRDDDGQERFVPGLMQRGAGTDQFVSGLPNGESYTGASIHESEPISIATLRESIELDIRLIYRQFRQSYRLQAAEGTLSGESRIQQRQEFELFLRGWQRKIESAIANILNVVLRILGYTNLEAVVSLNITTGKLSAEERSQIIAENQAGLLSKTTAIAQLGTVDDVDAELALLEEEMQANTRSRPMTAAEGAEETLPNPVSALNGNNQREDLGNGNGSSTNPATTRPA